MVSHDSGFLNDCCTDILQIERLKLKHYRGNLDHFLEINPEARAFFNLRESKLKFKFPQPGPIEGVKSRSKALMKMSHCYFTYDGNTVPTLFDISVQVSMCSRVGCVGENGAGKSKILENLTNFTSCSFNFTSWYYFRQIDYDKAVDWRANASDRGVLETSQCKGGICSAACFPSY